ncbi:MAG: bifunctional folylpolyglutamate synthase/dihydrofolate synthase [Christensenellales bacterium]|jgi:dihydrofolate synthase/folylpolyglutamate synthase
MTRSSIKWLNERVGERSVELSALSPLFDSLCPKPDIVVQVAGTNGKGSTCAFIDAVFTASGKRCGLFTSPHIWSDTERIKVCGEPITAADMKEGLKQARRAAKRLKIDEKRMNIFDWYFAIALCYFAKQNVDAMVLECGLGGRLDPTTAYPADISIICPVSLDHTRLLGDSVAAIAKEKAEIIRRGGVAIVQRQSEDAMEVIREKAMEKGAALIMSEEYEKVAAKAKLRLIGDFQLENAAAAAAVADCTRIEPKNIIRGLEAAYLPLRMEVMSENPYIICDAAHNPAAARALADSAEHPSVLVVGVRADKDAAGIAAALERFDTVITTEVDELMSARELARFFKAAKAVPKLEKAMEEAVAVSGGRPVYFTGSFILAKAAADLARQKYRPV